MKFVVQRVKNAQVVVDNKIIGKVNQGLMVLCGITHKDTEKEADYLVKKLCNLRIFEDENNKMNLSVKDINGDILLVSQFTLYANCISGNRPSFIEAANPKIANELYKYIIKKCKESKLNIQKGEFGANMQVSLVNDGPVTIILEK